MVVQAVARARILSSLFVTGMRLDLKVEEILALIYVVLWRLGNSVGSHPSRGAENICCLVSTFLGPKVSYGVCRIIVLATLVFWARRSQNF